MLETSFQTVFIVADAMSLREGTLHLLPALVILDLQLAGSDSLDLVRDIRELSPGTRVIGLSMHEQTAVARLALESGASAVITKHSLGSEFLPAIDAVLNGQEYISLDFNLTDSAH